VTTLLADNIAEYLHGPRRPSIWGWRPFTDPRYADPEYRRARILAMALLIIVLGALTAGILSVAAARPWVAPVLIVEIAAIVPALLVFQYLFIRRRQLPGFEVIAWVAARRDRAWADLDTLAPPLGLEDALARLDGHHDESAMSLRASSLLAAGRSDELRQLLASWETTDPIGQAHKARYESDVAHLEGRADDLRAAWTAADAIADPDDRAVEHAVILYDAAIRSAAARSDPYAPLVAARRILGSRDLEIGEGISAWRQSFIRKIGISLFLSTGLAFILVFTNGAFLLVALVGVAILRRLRSDPMSTRLWAIATRRRHRP